VDIDRQTSSREHRVGSVEQRGMDLAERSGRPGPGLDAAEHD
jgi:hypothetical protein